MNLPPPLTRVVRDLLPAGARLSLARTAVYLAVVAATCLLIKPAWWVADSATMTDDHAILSMEIAMSRTFCHTESAFSQTVRIPYEVRDHPALRFTPLKEQAIRRAGSLGAYCASIQSPLLNNENSLMWLDSWILFLRPDVSAAGLGRALHGLRIAGLLLFCGVTLYQGFGLITAATALFWSLALLQDLAPQVYSAYPFLPVLLLVTAAVYTIASERGWPRTWLAAIAGGAAAGAWTAFAVNMRTSHLPVYLILAATGVILGGRHRAAAAGKSSQIWRGVAALVALAIGYSAFQYTAIQRHLPESSTNLARHTIAHPLVLALGIPPNDLSRREGITWSDSAALEIARRIEPGVAYLGPRYESVLFGYYRGLWRAHRREMIGLYLLKARLAGKQMLEVLRGRLGRDGALVRIVLAPLDLLPNGIWLWLLYAGVAGTSAVRAWRGRTGACLILYTSIAAMLLHLEAVAIMSVYVPSYHAYLAFYVVWLSVVGIAGAVSMAWRVWRAAEAEPAVHAQ